MWLKGFFLSGALAALFVKRSVTTGTCAILVEGIKRNNSVKLFEFGSVVQEEMSFKRFLIWSSNGTLFVGAEPFTQF